MTEKIVLRSTAVLTAVLMLYSVATFAGLAGVEWCMMFTKFAFALS